MTTNTEFVAASRAICEKATPPDDPEQPDNVCAACGDAPELNERDWDRGDLCWPCQAEVFNGLRTILPEALTRLEAAEKEQAKLLQDVAGFDSLVADQGLCWCKEDSGLCLSPTCIAARELLADLTDKDK